MKQLGPVLFLASAALGAAASCKSSLPKQIETSDGGDDTQQDAAPQKSCAPSGLSKGPWTVAPTETSIKIRWEACNPGLARQVTIVPEQGTSSDAGASDAGASDAGASGQIAESVEKAFELKNTYGPVFGNAPPDVAGTWYSHEAEVKGLAPSTCYRYELAVDPEAKGRFCTARRSGESFRFMAIGDTNPTLGDNTTNVLKNALPTNPDFTLHAGDIEYYASTFETWAAWFPLMKPLLRQGALQTSIGNHESEKLDELDAYTLRFFGGSGSDGLGTSYRFESGGVYFFALDTEQPLGPGSPQGDWIVKSLADASQKPGYRFSVVWFHKPFVTCGDTSQDTGARNYLTPFFDQYKVPLVIQAHMHGYERFELGNITYVTAAGGGGAMGNVDENKSRAECAQRVVSGPWFHAVVFDVEPGKLSGKVINEKGETKDTFSKVVP